MSNQPDLEEKILEEIAEIERRLAELSSERDALQRLLIRIHNERVGGRTDARINSGDRLLVESRILQALRDAGGTPVSTRQLLKEARVANPALKDGTFRSYLHRLRMRALISPAERRYAHWVIKDAPNIGT